MVEVVPLGEDMEEGQKDDNESHYHKYEEETDEIKYYSGLGVSNTNEVQLVEDGIYWSEAVEETISPGLSDDLVQDEILALRSRTVKSLDTPTWLKCGRDKNRFVTFSDGVHACARYREPDQQLVLGEVMSFYLARTLGLTNVPAVILSQVDPNHPMWRRVTEDVATSDWRVGSVVALIQWIPSLQRSHMPAILRQALKARTTIDTVTYDRRASRDVSRAASVAQARLRDLDITEAAEVAQWSDLVVFDYLTGNYDRVASMQVIFLENQTRVDRDKPRTLEFGLLFKDFGLLLWTENGVGGNGMVVAHETLETAQSPNSFFPFLFDFGLGLGLVNYLKA